MRKIFSIIRLLISLPLAVNAWAPQETYDTIPAIHIEQYTPMNTAPLPMATFQVNR